MASIQMSPETYTKLLKAERDLTDLIPEFDKSESCGIDCQAYRAATQDMLHKIQMAKMHFGPKSA